MKKIIKFGIIISIVLCIISISAITYATTNNTDSPYVKSETIVNDIENNQIQVTLKLSNFANVGEGINAYTGFMKFNANELEFVEFINVSNWNNPTYKISGNEMKVVSTSNKFLKEDGVIFKAVFNKKVNKDKYDIEISNLELAAKVNDKTIKVLANAQTTENIEHTEKVNEKNPQKVIVICSIVIVVIAVAFVIFKRNKGGK